MSCNTLPLYHIDTTKEEDALFKDEILNEQTSKPFKLQFRNVFYTVLGIHVLILGSLGWGTLIKADTPKPIQPQQPPKIQETVVAPETTTKEPLQTPAIKTPPVNIKPTQENNKSALAKTYVLKPGDTIYSIAKKYKVDCTKLQKINNIKDPKKIVAGQTLKLL